MIASGFRSPAYQAITFIRLLHDYKGDLKKTLKRVAPPNYSQHNDIKNLAVDFWPANDSFEETEEYQWLLNNAGRYGLELSFPENNSQGVDFEPWHWRLVC